MRINYLKFHDKMKKKSGRDRDFNNILLLNKTKKIMRDENGK